MSKNLHVALAAAEQRLRTERKWMSLHGETRTAYRQQYGVNGETFDDDGNPAWYGDGGDAIYDADRAVLDRAKADVSSLRARLNK